MSMLPLLADAVGVQGDASLLGRLMDYMLVVADWSVPVIIFTIVIYGLFKGVKLYEVFVEGAKEGFQIAVTIMPYLVAILVAIGLMRDVTLLGAIGDFLEPFIGWILPPEMLPMAIIRPLSGGGASGFMNSIMIEYGPDSYLGIMASVMMGSTETTFYVLAVYFGAVNVKNSRHAIAAGLTGDLAGIIAAAVLCKIFFGNLIGQ